MIIFIMQYYVTYLRVGGYRYMCFARLLTQLGSLRRAINILTLSIKNLST